MMRVNKTITSRLSLLLAIVVFAVLSYVPRAFGVSVNFELCERLLGNVPSRETTQHLFNGRIDDLPIVPRMKPTDFQFKSIRSLIKFQIRRLSDFRQISYESLRELMPLEGASGAGSSEVLVGTLGDQRVVVKVMNPKTRSVANVVNEGRNVLILNQLGMGPKFFGVTKNTSGLAAIVLEYVEGVHVSPKYFSRKLSVRVTPEMIESVRHTGELLRDAGYRYTPDVQFIVTTEGRAVLIDAEFFSAEIPRFPPVDLPWDPVVNCEQIARYLEDQMAIQRREGVPSSPQPKNLPNSQKFYNPGDPEPAQNPKAPKIYDPREPEPAQNPNLKILNPREPEPLPGPARRLYIP